MKKNASEIWKDYLEGEVDIRLKPSMARDLMTAMKNQSVYCKYLVHGTARKSKSAESSEELSEILYTMCEDPEITAYYMLHAIREGADVLWMSSHKDCALHLLAKNKAGEAFACAISDPKLKCAPVNTLGQTPLILACQGSTTPGQLKIVQCLTEHHNSSIDHQDNQQYSALYYAWKYKNYLAVKYLLSQNASVLANLPQFTLHINGLVPLERFLQGKDLHAIDISTPRTISSNANTVSQSYKTDPEVWKFFDAANVAADMIDYHTTTDIQMHFYAQRLGVDAVINGMMYFRVREEMRSRKAGSTSNFLQHSLSAQMKQLEEVEARYEKENEIISNRFQEDLQKRNSAHQKHKQQKCQSITYKRQQDEYQRLDTQRAEMKARIEGQFVSKLGKITIPDN